MDFFVPNESGEGRMAPEEAEEAWQACWKGAEDDMGREALARRVYRLDYIHNGRVLHAVVGEREHYYEKDWVMAIIAFPGCYSIRCAVRGYLKVGDPIIVGGDAVRYVEDFD